jgi:hypothetical protein
MSILFAELSFPTATVLLAVGAALIVLLIADLATAPRSSDAQHSDRRTKKAPSLPGHPGAGG